MSRSTPPARVRVVQDAPLRPTGDFVLYWMIATRRTTSNFALDRAVEHAAALKKPIVVLEPLRAGYRWRSDRIDTTLVAGMSDNARRFAGEPVAYYPYVEPEAGAGQGLLAALAERACVVITDDFPCIFLPRMVRAAGEQLSVRLEAVDSNGIVPMRSTPDAFPTAYSFRRYLHRNLSPYLGEAPYARQRVAGVAPRIELPPAVVKRWPLASLESVPPRGATAAQQTLVDFLARLDRYGDDRNSPENDATSGLSSALHFGHISPHEIFHELADQEDWTPDDLADTVKGNRAGWWGMSESAEGFLDQLITWRELGYNMCVHRPDDYDRYESLPSWAQVTLEAHAGDEREFVYTLEQFDTAQTHDPIWNAAQTQLRREGRIHNYLRMLWGKKILEWTASPRDALAVMIELNNKYALDGRNPNSYSGIFWCLGRYDRAWGPERPIFGKIRYMSSDNTRRKYKLKSYLEAYSS